MSYQVNYRMFIADCEFYEAEILSKLQCELHEAVMKVIEGYVKGKQVGLSSAEVVYLNK